MRQVFISYARDDRERVEALAERLRRLVDGVWFDSQLHGGEDWWAGILDRIRGCDIFLAVVSPASLDSEACQIEREYAASVNRTIVPVAIEAVPPALPGDIASLQIVDFSQPGEQSLADLARALLAAPDPESLPDPLPPDPEAPLSYLTDLVDLVNSSRELTKSEQMEILFRLERGLESSDRDEREGARQVLLRMKNRDDLAASVEKTISLLARENVPDVSAGPPPGPEPSRPAPTPAARPPSPAPGAASHPQAPARPGPSSGPSPTRTQPTQKAPRRRGVVVAVVLVLLAVAAGTTWALIGRGGGDDTEVSVGDRRTETTAPETTEPGGDGNGGDGEPACQPPLDRFPGRVEPETCNEAYGDNRVREWSWVLLAEGIIGGDASNCNGCYTGPLVSNVRDWQERNGFDPDGVLDETLYQCLAHGECPSACEPVVVPSVVTIPVDDAQVVLSDAGLVPVVREERTDVEPFPSGMVLDQNPPAGAEACVSDEVVITVSAP